MRLIQTSLSLEISYGVPGKNGVFRVGRGGNLMVFKILFIQDKVKLPEGPYIYYLLKLKNHN